ncbi:MAG: S-layer homology domain-containing protein [Phormidesmis sp. RL_2_1]|nr:S-layer homology domain-containing protein [Phormidesmis sp. RL_2_1]
MTQSPIEPPNDPRRSDARPPTPPAIGPSRPLTFDEMVALLVAFLSLGSVLFWGLSRNQMSFLNNSLVSISPPVASSEVAPESLPESSFDTATDGSDLPDPSISARGEGVTAPLSAREELAARTAERRRGASPRRLWDDMRAGVASAAAGIAGVAATSEEAEALPDAGTTVPGTTVPGTTVPGTVDQTAPPAAAPSSTLTLSEAATATPQAALRFDDVPDNYWAKPYIDALTSRGLMSGFAEGDFQPEQAVTRAQIATVVANTFDLTAEKENLEFSDVQGDYWARESIGEVVKGGFMTGFPNGTFEPNTPVTRAQAFTTLVTGLKVATPNNVQAALSRYTDANAIPNWANEKVAAATASSFVVNYPNLEQLNPNKPTTRAELAVMIYQALVKEGAVEPMASDYVVKP